MLTARDGVADRIRGLDAGADHYLVKPFDFGEPVARLRALLRRGAPERPAVLTAGDLELDPATRTVTRAGRLVSLSTREFAVLEYLLRRAGHVVGRSDLLEHVWDRNFEGSTNVVDVCVGCLRRKLEEPFGRPLLRRLQRVAAEQTGRSFGLPVLVGLEKAGGFAEHAAAIHEHVPRGSLMVLTEPYVQTYITFKGSTHGEDTYYGRHFFYHSNNGSMFTMTVPPLGRVDAVPTEEFAAEDNPALRATCDVLDRIGTRLCENATIPWLWRTAGARTPWRRPRGCSSCTPRSTSTAGRHHMGGGPACREAKWPPAAWDAASGRCASEDIRAR
jgi:hypothetical protein